MIRDTITGFAHTLLVIAMTLLGVLYLCEGA